MGALGRGRVRDERRPNVQVPLNTPAVCVCVVEYAHAMPVQLMYEHEWMHDWTMLPCYILPVDQTVNHWLTWLRF